MFFLVFVLLRDHIFLPESYSVSSLAALIMQDIVLRGRKSKDTVIQTCGLAPQFDFGLFAVRQGVQGSDELKLSNSS